MPSQHDTQPLDKEYLDQISRQAEKRLDLLHQAAVYDALNPEKKETQVIHPKFAQFMSWQDCYIYSQARKQAEDAINKVRK
uniref:HEPN domain-containing protein n=1 Tax=Bursaphelenchus xylophilus TaxID=6326 RepID=A0A1I7SWY5_BURXY